MTIFTAVFNQHVNNAAKRARKQMAKECPTYLDQVKRRTRAGGGIMAIFDEPQLPGFVRYAELVQQFVNEDCATTVPKAGE